MSYYILDTDGTPEPCHDLMVWANWFEHIEKRRIARDVVADGVEVSTVFLGIDHSFGGGPPLLFETLVFGGAHDGEMERYHTHEEALAGHREMIERLRS